MRMAEVETILQTILNMTANIQRSLQERAIYEKKLLCQNENLQTECLLRSKEAQAACSAKEAIEQEKQSILLDKDKLLQEVEALQRHAALESAAALKEEKFNAAAIKKINALVEQVERHADDADLWEQRNKKIVSEAEEELHRHLQQWQEEKEHLLNYQKNLLCQNETLQTMCILKSREAQVAYSLKEAIEQEKQSMLQDKDKLLQEVEALHIYALCESNYAMELEKSKVATIEPLVERVKRLTEDAKLVQQSDAALNKETSSPNEGEMEAKGENKVKPKKGRIRRFLARMRRMF